MKWWAAAGAAVILLQVYVFGDWILSGNATPTPTGPTPVPDWMETVGVVAQVANLVVFAGFLWFVVIQPWRRTGRVTVDGLFVGAFLLLYWQDPLVNYSQNWMTYNANLVNFGSWTTSVPGWLAPNGNLLPEPIVFAAPFYVTALFGFVMVSNAVMRAVHRRWPQLGRLGLMTVCFAFLAVFDLIMEPVLLRSGIFAYPGAISWLTIAHGRYYQFPVYEAAMVGIVMTAWASMRYFRDDRGRTRAERGVDDLRISERSRTGLRFLAIVGMTNLMFLGLYNVPIQWFALHADSWIPDVTNRSYLTNGLCGPGTDYACSGPGIPIFRPDSVRIGPEGRATPVPR